MQLCMSERQEILKLVLDILIFSVIITLAFEKKHASLWVNLLCGSLAIYSLLRPGKLNQSCGSNQPTAAFFRLLCFVHLPQKVRGIFALKMRKTGSAAVRSTTAEPVFVDFTVFWAIFALKARKLPDLSGRQIRQLIWCERGDLNSHVG